MSLCFCSPETPNEQEPLYYRQDEVVPFVADDSDSDDSCSLNDRQSNLVSPETPKDTNEQPEPCVYYGQDEVVPFTPEPDDSCSLYDEESDLFGDDVSLLDLPYDSTEQVINEQLDDEVNRSV